MPSPLSGPGLGLPIPQGLYPSALTNAPLDNPSNQIALAPGDAMPLPAGDYYVSTGSYGILQFLDPVSNTWQGRQSQAWTGAPLFVKSDGFNYRIANLTGCVASLSITATGSAYVQASTTFTLVGGFVGAVPTAVPIVGGALAVVGGTLSSNGAGYGVAPLVFIPPPPPAANNANGVGGVQASAYAGIASGTVSFVSIVNPGAGYPSAPTAVILPNPTDPNLSTGITQATVAFSLTGSGQIRGALLTNSGSPLPNGSMANVTVTIGGAGTGATVAANVMQTAVAGTVVGTGLGYGTVGALLTSTGGGGSAGTITNSPEFLGLAFRPRPAQINLAVTAGGTLSGQTGTIVDGGLFLSGPNAVIITNPLPAANVTISGATVSFIMGSTPDIITVQPAP